ncbi:MAG: hypothetical protein ACM3SR_14095 [Ignavibacteriales bacterium]
MSSVKRFTVYGILTLSFIASVARGGRQWLTRYMASDFFHITDKEEVMDAICLRERASRFSHEVEFAP